MLEGRARALPFSLCACRAGLRGLCDAGAVTTGGSLRTSEPIFNVPTVVSATIALLVLIHAARAWVLTQEQDIELLLLFSFIPARYDATVLAQGAVPGGIGAEIRSFVTYALIHGDWVHLGINSVWLLAFGTPVARRFGAVRYLAFFAVTSAAGAAAHLATHSNAFVPMVGASASISGFMEIGRASCRERG